MWSKRALVALAVAVASLVLVAGCSSDSDPGATSQDGSGRSTTTARSGGSGSPGGSSGSSGSSPGSSSSSAAPPVTEPISTTTMAPETVPSTTVVKPDGGPSSFRGVVDGQPKVAVTFRRDGSNLVGLRADDLVIVCQPLAEGSKKDRAVDVRIPRVPVGADGYVSYTQQGADYEPSVTGTFTSDGRFAGSLFLNGRDDGYACGGEFTFIAVHG